MSEQAPAIDLAAVMDRLGGDEALLREIAGLYIEDEQRLLGDAGSAIRNRDADLLRRSAHTIKGAVSNFSAPAAWSAAQALESAGRDGRLDEAPALLERLNAELARLRAALAPYLT